MNTEQFAAYISRGTGRPYLYLQDHASTPYEEALLHACLYNPTYDLQFEGSRAAYLYELIKLTPNQHFFEQRIVEAFADCADDMDIEQLFDFALIYAHAGNKRARHLMYERFLTQAGDGNDFGASQLIELDGIDGFRFVAARLGEAIIDDPDFWDDNQHINFLQERFPDITEADIEALGTSNPSVQRYLDKVAQTMARRKQNSKNRENSIAMSYQQLKEKWLKEKMSWPRGRLQRWGKQASNEDLEAAAHDLLAQTDTNNLSLYLAIFSERQFPLDFHYLLPLVQHDDDRVAIRALNALGLVQDASLRQLGFALLEERRYIGNSLGLFVLNFHDGDEAWLISLLDSAQTDEEVHDLGFTLLDILAHNRVARAAEILNMLYEREPCSLCRKNAVKQLAEMNAIPEWMLHECLHDANEEIQQIARLCNQ